MKKNLNGYGKQFKSCDYNGKPTDKQMRILIKLRQYYGKDKIPYCETKSEAWHLIKHYEKVIKFDRKKNEFYIEENIVEDEVYENDKTIITIVSDEELECIKLVNYLRSILSEKELEEYEILINHLGDYSIISEVTQILIDQYQKANYEKIMLKHEVQQNPVTKLQKKLIAGIKKFYGDDLYVPEFKNDIEARKFIQEHTDEIYMYQSRLVIGIDKHKRVVILNPTVDLWERDKHDGLYKDKYEELYKELGVAGHTSLTYLRCINLKISKSK